jgi:(p)ppGpp synthase/HD superfamily hydrolase
MIWTQRLQDARQFFRVAHDSIGQVRKYTGKPYWTHTEAVAELVASFGGDETLIVIALGHDFAEDVVTRNSNFSMPELRRLMGDEVADGILHLTDVYTSENYPKLNRATIKK